MSGYVELHMSQEAITDGNLILAMKKLHSGTKQAFYAAANKGTIHRGSWDGCAFNAGSKELGSNVKTIQTAAVAFGEVEQDVSTFIRVWDQTPGSNEWATERLKEVILAVGLFSEPEDFKGHKRLTRIVATRVFTGNETKMREEFEALMEVNGVKDADFAAELLTIPVPA